LILKNIQKFDKILFALQFGLYTKIVLEQRNGAKGKVSQIIGPNILLQGRGILLSNKKHIKQTKCLESLS